MRAGDAKGIASSARSLNALALGLLARLSLAEGKPAEAIEFYRRSLETLPSSERRLEFASALLRAGRTRDAITELNGLVSADPNNAIAWMTLGSALKEEGQNKEAVTALTRALELRPETRVAFALGSAYLALHDKAKAQQIFAGILANSGDSAIWNVAVGDAYRDADYLDEAVIQLKAALARDPRVLHGEFFLGLTYLQLNRWGPSSESFLHLRRAVAQHPREYISNFYLGALESTDGSDLASSDRHLHVAAEADATQPEVWLYLGINAVREKNNGSAETYLRKAIELTGADEGRNGYQIRRAYLALGRLLLLKGEQTEGQAMLTRYRAAEQRAVASSAPAGAAGNDPTGIFLNLHSTAAAAEAETTVTPDASRLDAGHLAALKGVEARLRTLLGSSYNDLGTAEARQQEYAAALKDFEQSERWDPSNGLVLRNLGIAAFRVGDSAEAARALSLYAKGSKASGQPVDAHSELMLALSQFSVGDFAGAVKSFGSVEGAALSDPRTAYSYAFALARTGHAQESNQIADKLAGEPLPADVLPLVCHIYMDNENYEGSQSCYRKALAAQPDLPLAHYEIGESLIRLDRPADAIPELRQELQRSPDNANVAAALAFALLQTSQKKEARALLEQTLQRSPEHGEAQYEYGKLLLDEGDFAGAIPHLEASEVANSAKDYVHYQLATAYRKAGRAADAEREFKAYREIKDRNRSNATPH